MSPPTLGSRAWLHHQGSLGSSILQRGGGGRGRSSAHRPTCLTFPNRLEVLPQQAEPALSAAPRAPNTSVATQAWQGEAQKPPRRQPAQQELVSLTHHPGRGGRRAPVPAKCKGTPLPPSQELEGVPMAASTFPHGKHLGATGNRGRGCAARPGSVPPHPCAWSPDQPLQGPMWPENQSHFYPQKL